MRAQSIFSIQNEPKKTHPKVMAKRVTSAYSQPIPNTCNKQPWSLIVTSHFQPGDAMMIRGGSISASRRQEERRALATRNHLRTGCSVPDSGIYRVIHSQHQLPKEVTLIGNQPFPRCSKCVEPVYFQLVRSARAMGTTAHAFNVP